MFTTQLCQYFSMFCLFALFSDKPEVFLPKYSQTAILHAVLFQRVVKTVIVHAIAREESKARSHIETQLNSTVELSWVSVGFYM